MRVGGGAESNVSRLASFERESAREREREPAPELRLTAWLLSMD